MEEGKLFKPLGLDKEEEERRGRCAYCGGYFTSKNDITFIAVHKKECKRKVWNLIIQAERGARPTLPSREVFFMEKCGGGIVGRRLGLAFVDCLLLGLPKESRNVRCFDF